MYVDFVKFELSCYLLTMSTLMELNSLSKNSADGKVVSPVTLKLVVVVLYF